MRGLACVRILRTVGLLAIGGLLLSASSLSAGEWAPLGLDAYAPGPDSGGTAPAYQGGIVATPVRHAADVGLEDRVGQLEAALAEIRAKQAAAKQEAAGKPSVTVGGRIILDTAGFNQDAMSHAQVGDQQNGVEFRQARIFLKGSAFHVIDYKIQFDFADTNTVDNTTIQSTAFKDVYMVLKELPILGHVRVGHFKEPCGLEQLASFLSITFMERSLPDNGAFVPGRNTGIMAYDNWAGEYGTWAIGCFVADMTAEPPIYKDDDGGLALTMRGTYLPWYDEATDGRGLWHVGASFSFRDTHNDTVRFRQRPECHIANYIVDTGNIPDVPSWQLLGLETAMVHGPFSVQAEWFCSFVHRTVDEDLFFNGGYVYVSYFLTGEHRPYKKSGGVFDRVRPFENFFRVRAQDGNVYTGKGAWELAYRYSYLDLSEYDSGHNHPGIVHDHTIGLNWYLNPYTRVMFNYVNSTLDNPLGVGNMSIFEMRAQIDF